MTLVVFLLSATLVVASVVAPIVVDTPLGKVSGLRNEVAETFRGIPYAEPPIGNLRFRRTVPKRPWTGTFNAQRFGHACPQLIPSIPTQWSNSEDCLILNVYRPIGTVSTTKLPVLVFIHGGSFNVGTANEYEGGYMARRGLIVVAINYRLAVLGYLQDEELAKEDKTWPSYGGMNGFMDQVTALEWVQANIAAFGGDPTRVTISGESAGALSMNFHLSSNYTKKRHLFHQVIIESGSTMGPWTPAPFTFAFNTSRNYMKAVGVTTVAELRAMHPIAMMKPSALWNLVGPGVDGVLFQELPWIGFLQGELSLPPGGKVLLGSNTQDTLVAPPFKTATQLPNTPTKLQENWKQFFGDNTTTLQHLMDLYPTSPHPVVSFIHMSRDTCVTCPTRLLANSLFNSMVNGSIYLYQFGFNANPLYFGAPHGAELPLVFNQSIAPILSFNQPLSNSIGEYWSSFVKSGVPTSTTGSVAWTPYDPSGQHYLYFDVPEVSLRSGYESPQCDYWARMGSKPFPLGNSTADQMISFCDQKHIGA